MFVKRLGSKDDRFDIFLGKGWDNHIRVQVTNGKEENEVKIINKPAFITSRSIHNGIARYFNRGK